MLLEIDLWHHLAVQVQCSEVHVDLHLGVLFGCSDVLNLSTIVAQCVCMKVEVMAASRIDLSK